jgi:hypothetical protein
MKPEPAKLGGFLARKHHGQPGSQTIGTEYEKTAQRKMKCACRAVNPSGGRGSCRAFNLGRARLLPSRQPWEGDAPAEPLSPREGDAPAEPSTPWEGDAPAEPSTPWECDAPAEPPTLGGRGSCRAANPGRAMLPPSRQNLGVRCSRRAVEPLGGRGSCRAANLGSAMLPPSRTSVFSNRKVPPLGEGGSRRTAGFSGPAGVRLSRSFALPKTAFGSAGASPSQRQRSAQQELRPPKAVNTVGKGIVAAHCISR